MAADENCTRRAFIGAMLVLPCACYAQPGVRTDPVRSQKAGRSSRLRQVPGCEGCEAAWERDPSQLRSQVRLASSSEPGEPLFLRGTVYKSDGRTPAPGVVLYFHHTNAAGAYAGGTNDSEWSRRHGRLRGWVKTAADGAYEVITVKPGMYPDRSSPAHIHIFVLEQGKDPYWIDDVVFDGEPRVDAAYRAARENRGGPGIVRLEKRSGGTLHAVRRIVLE